MTPERWLHVKRIFEAAVEREPNDRPAFLAEECCGDDELRAEVESLLEAHGEIGSFLETGAIDSVAGLLAAEAEPVETGRRVGAYSIVREIGRGGMGSVYLGVRADDQFRKQVAIKLIRSGMDSDFVVRRFRTERQILANLDHPNIARLLDGGATEDGLPYFVMEYIEGKPIDEYCDDHGLTVRERLGLFREVCSAVQYAHQNLVVHRDIKPSNILVTTAGVPKLLDFGIAKILDPAQANDETSTAVALMTPDFASPEQVRGEPITTSSDIYSLGVVLYTLLTGQRPYTIKSRLPEEILRVVCNEEPPKPSSVATAVHKGRTGVADGVVTAVADSESQAASSGQGEGRSARMLQPEKLRRRLAGDLDNIVMMAMRKEPARRYASVEQFSEDIRRYLDELPVIARTDAFGYRFGKFVRRHRIGVAAAGLIAALLIGGMIAVAREAHIASVERTKAEQRFNDVRKLADSYMFEFNDAIKDLPGATPARELLVKRALEYLDSLAIESGDNPSLSRDLATAYQKVGDIQGRPGFPNLGDKAGALASYKKSLAIREALVARDPSNTGIKSELIVSYERLGDVMRMTGDTAGALDNYQKGLALDEQLRSTGSSPENTAELASMYDRIGDALAIQGNLAEGLEDQSRSLSLRETLLASDEKNPELRRSLMISHIKVGDMLMGLGKTEQALETYRKAEPIGKGLSDEYENNSRFRRELTICYDKIGNALSADHQYSPALDYFKKSLAIREDLSSRDPKNAEARRDLSVSYDKIGTSYVGLKKSAEALAYYKQLLDNDQSLAEADKSSEVSDDLSISLIEYADLQLETGDLRGAFDNYRKSLAIREQLCKEDPSNASLQVELAEAYRKMGDGFSHNASNQKSASSDWRQARAWYQKSFDLLTALKKGNVLNHSGAEDLETTKARIAACDAALARDSK